MYTRGFGRQFMLQRSLAAVVLLLTFSSATASAQEAQAPAGWSDGPTVGRLGTMASIPVPEGFTFLDAQATKRFLEASQNIPDGDELGILLRTLPNDDHWFAVFSYADTGHVDDSERNAIDADGLMKNMKEGNRRGNEERRRRGWAELTLDGWHQKPFYDTSTNNLTWATSLTSEGEGTINHSVRLLGRTGTMSVQLVASPKTAEAATSEFNTVLRGFTYNEGQRYAEFRQGDKLAGYGLTALIAGGAGAAAVKSGLLQKAWKFIVLIVVAAAAAMKRFFAALFGRKEEPELSGPPPQQAS
jgi:uncharacterized membrane-anchored protein